MSEAERRIREALEKAPTHGEWVAYRTGGRPEVSHAIPPFIAAYNPTNIAALLAGISIIVVPDDDDRVKDLPPETAAVRGGKLYVGETLWPVLRDALRAQAAKDAEAR